MRKLNDRQRQRDRAGYRRTCSACGHPETTSDRLVRTPDGFRVHTSHLRDPRSGLYEPGR